MNFTPSQHSVHPYTLPPATNILQLYPESTIHHVRRRYPPQQLSSTVQTNLASEWRHYQQHSNRCIWGADCAITLKKEFDRRDGCGYASKIDGVPAADAAGHWIAKVEAMTGVRAADGAPDADPSTASNSGTSKAPTTSTGSQY